MQYTRKTLTSGKTAPLFGMAVLAAFGLVAAHPAQAQTLLTSRTAVAGNDFVDWSQVGPDYTSPSATFTSTSSLGTTVTVTQPSGNFQKRTEGNSWYGNFGSGDAVLWNVGNGPTVTFTFSNGVSAAGTQISADYYGAYTAQVQAFGQSHNLLGTFTEAGNMNGDNDNSAIFLGVADTTAPIYSLVYDLTSASGAPNDFAVNRLTMNDATPAPEPSSVAAFAFTGLGALGLILKARKRKAQVG